MHGRHRAQPPFRFRAATTEDDGPMVQDAGTVRVVTDRHAIAGAAVEAFHPIFAVADSTSTLVA
jgi:hypothetical protein